MPERLAWPLQLTATGTLATVEQDSDEDIAQCLLAIGRTLPGDRWDAPEMGVDPRTFHELPIDLTQLTATLAKHEPRATTTVTDTSPIVRAAVDQVVVELELGFQPNAQTENTP